MHGFTKKELLELAWEKPILAQIEITRKCNQTCIFCYTGQKAVQTNEDLSLIQWKEIVVKLKNLGIRRLDFTGRENLMHLGFSRLVKYCKSLGFEIRVNTNGTLDVSEILSDVDEIIFSVHGIGAVHNKIVGNDKSFDLICENVKRTANSGIKISVNMSLVRTNYDQMMDVFSYFDSKYGLHKFAPVVPVASLFGNIFEKEALIVSKEFLENYKYNLKKIPARKLTLKHGFQSIFFDQLKYYENNGLLLPNCAAGKYKLIIESDGKVFPCNFFKSEKFYCGNILVEDENKIWKSGSGFEYFRKLVIEEKIPGQCGHCLKKPRCFSGCRAWTATYRKGGFENAKDQRCDFGAAFIRN
jgi:radical SAM protein with 4Fe4S-binding SPASM domain